MDECGCRVRAIKWMTTIAKEASTQRTNERTNERREREKREQSIIKIGLNIPFLMTFAVEEENKDENFDCAEKLFLLFWPKISSAAR